MDLLTLAPLLADFFLWAEAPDHPTLLILMCLSHPDWEAAVKVIQIPVDALAVLLLLYSNGDSVIFLF